MTRPLSSETILAIRLIDLTPFRLEPVVVASWQIGQPIEIRSPKAESYTWLPVAKAVRSSATREHHELVDATFARFGGLLDFDGKLSMEVELDDVSLDEFLESLFS